MRVILQHNIVMGGGGPNIQTRNFFALYTRPHEEGDAITSNVPSSTKRDREKKILVFQWRIQGKSKYIIAAQF